MFAWRMPSMKPHLLQPQNTVKTRWAPESNFAIDGITDPNDRVAVRALCTQRDSRRIPEEGLGAPALYEAERFVNGIDRTAAGKQRAKPNDVEGTRTEMPVVAQAEHRRPFGNDESD